MDQQEELPVFTIGVIQYTRQGETLYPETIDTHVVSGYNAHDKLVTTLRQQYADRPDIQIVGPGHIIYKDIDQAAIPQTAEATADHPITYSLIVSNVGIVRRNDPDEQEVRRLYTEYAQSGQYAQVTLWSSKSDDPIAETYDETVDSDEDEEE